MKFWDWFILSIFLYNKSFVNSAVIPNENDPDEQGLYSKSDHVKILTNLNFEKKIYGQKHALLVQFYNSYCGHCRAFSPKFKSMAVDFVPWHDVIQLAVIDCSVEENNEMCRDFEIFAYPSLRYLHENYTKGNGNIGDQISLADTAENLKIKLISVMIKEQASYRLKQAPPLDIGAYSSYASVFSEVPKDINFVFIVFENENSTVGANLALDINDYKHVRVKRIYDTSDLAENSLITHFPSLVVVKTNLDAIPLTPKIPTPQNNLIAVNNFLKTKDFVFPTRHEVEESNIVEPLIVRSSESNFDNVYYSDLEKTLKTSLHTEIARYKELSGESLKALIDFLNVILLGFPFRGNLKEYIYDLRNTLDTKTEWNGSDVYQLVKDLENLHAPVYTSNLEFERCKGSQNIYRGYSCGLWTLFHTLTVNAARLPGVNSPKVLQAMHGYIKHFFGCTECSEHFQAMSERNRLFDIKENDKAVLWLWISHNEVNLRLAGDATEDPEHPKVQFPSIAKCPECRLARGAWNLQAVYRYLESIYASESIHDRRKSRSAAAVLSPFSNLDLGMLSILYILSFFILILVLKYFFTKRFYRKRISYKHGWGKV